MPYEAYFEAASEALILVDKSGRIVHANLRAGEVFEYEPTEMMGLSIEALIPERLHQAHKKHRADYSAAPRSRPMGIGMELAARCKDGREFPVEVSLTHAHRDGDDLVICLVADISDRLARERENRRAETLRTLGSLAAGVAHDLNNPLTIIMSRVELILAEHQALPESARADLGVVHHHAQRASHMVRDLMALARQHPKAFEPVNINQVVDDALLLINGEMRSKGITVQTKLDRGLPPIMGDAVALQQVMMNLLINAKEALSDEGSGVIHIETALHPTKPARLQLLVADNGPGVSPDILPRIFDFLYTNKPGGTGLGLWLSRRIVQEHHGSIEVSSQPGHGATFVLNFPVPIEESGQRL